MGWKDDRAVRMVGSFVGMALLPLAIAAACGSPDGEHREFVYTPVPYVTIDDSRGGTQALALAPGSPTFPDRVEATELDHGPSPSITIVDDRGRTRTLALDQTAEGSIYRVDEIVVDIRLDDEMELVEWLDEWGFSVKTAVRVEEAGFAEMWLSVPPGSAPDAVELMLTNKNVEGARPSVLSFLIE